MMSEAQPRKTEKFLVYVMEMPLSDEKAAELKRLLDSNIEDLPEDFDQQAYMQKFFGSMAREGRPMNFRMEIVERFEFPEMGERGKIDQ